MTKTRMTLAAAPLALMLAACGGGGGGGGGGGLNSTPPPAPTPTPAPAPTPTPTPTPIPPPIPDRPIGLTSSAPFKTYSAHENAAGALVADVDGVKFEYSAANDEYTITLPGYQEGRLVTTGGNGSFNSGSSTWLHLSATVNAVTVGATSATQPVIVALDWPDSSEFTYTDFGRWLDPDYTDISGDGVFAYGIPTAPGDVPITGSATYTGSIRGLTSDGFDVWGGVSLAFDFGAGSLSGSMTPEFAPEWDAISLGVYTFRDTVYSAGQTSFSGAFNAPGLLTGPSSFQGSFTGPSATELMASWLAPYHNPVSHQNGTIAGVWIAKRP